MQLHFLFGWIAEAIPFAYFSKNHSPMRSFLFTSLFLLVGISLSAQTLDKAQLEALTEKQWQSGIRLLNELVSMPNDAVFPKQIAVNIAWCEAAFSQRNWSVERLETGGIPLLLVEKKQPNAKKTALFFQHAILNTATTQGFGRCKGPVR